MLKILITGFESIIEFEKDQNEQLEILTLISNLELQM